MTYLLHFILFKIHHITKNIIWNMVFYVLLVVVTILQKTFSNALYQLKRLTFNLNFIEVCSECLIDNKSILVYVKAWGLTGDKP